MENNIQQGPITKGNSTSLLRSVFTFMTAGLGITGAIAYWFGSSRELLGYLINFETGSHTILGWVVMLAPLGFVLLISGMYRRLSATAMSGLFVAFSAIMGISLSYIFLIYDIGAIYKTFLITAGTFGVMAFAGYTTKQDLSKMGSILMMALVGIIIASVANFFFRSGQLDYIISIIGVLVFTGLTAWDVQKIKRIQEENPEAAADGKLAIMGALTLYLDFINLFLFLLRIFGGNRD